MGRSTLRLGVLSVLVATAHGWASPPPVTSAASEAAMTLSFFVLADWGGQAAPPYTNYNELGARGWKLPGRLSCLTSSALIAGSSKRSAFNAIPDTCRAG